MGWIFQWSVLCDAASDHEPNGWFCILESHCLESTQRTLVCFFFSQFELFLFFSRTFYSIAQPKRLLTKTELVLMNILNAHENDDATVVRAGLSLSFHHFSFFFFFYKNSAEDCGAAVATKLPTRTCINLLQTVIDDENSKYHQLSGAIKMLSHVISKLPPKEVFFTIFKLWIFSSNNHF